MKNFFIFIPIRDDWGVLHNHRVRGYKSLKKAKEIMKRFDSGHIADRKDFFVLIKQKGKILYEQ